MGLLWVLKKIGAAINVNNPIWMFASDRATKKIQSHLRKTKTSVKFIIVKIQILIIRYQEFWLISPNDVKTTELDKKMILSCCCVREVIVITISVSVLCCPQLRAHLSPRRCHPLSDTVSEKLGYKSSNHGLGQSFPVGHKVNPIFVDFNCVKF